MCVSVNYLQVFTYLDWLGHVLHVKDDRIAKKQYIIRDQLLEDQQRLAVLKKTLKQPVYRSLGKQQDDKE